VAVRDTTRFLRTDRRSTQQRQTDQACETALE
jgi:hypothetical protein